MEVYFKKSFIKDLKDLPKNIQRKIKKLVFDEIPNKNSLSEISEVKKLKGAEYYYRIRMGDYRIGFKYENGKIIFYRALHRNQIYKRFP
ncbi:type II toxin-antitoxin system RelE/ParE family toxin [Methanothermococcus sp.]|uniref:type II toxin-antitoxin system RelE family toxin n=1 Tax=Methanothermococcus sp. TaxID=2614238 RepID=UPI0025F4FC97|nr:type II toxin-antitoxin system RelE/ParE family toxin [Methanothermococcus sp.]